MEWIRGSTIGRGSSATVSVAKARQSGELFAVKSVELCKSDMLKREQRILSSIRCDQIISYVGSDITAENGKEMYNLFMEYVSGGTITDAIQKSGGRLGEASIRAHTYEVLRGLEYLHCNGLVHCDIKGSNILIGSDGAKIADLGCAKLIDGASRKVAIAGTPLFMAPEVARGDEQGFPADVWAVGCTLIEMATGRPPWPDVQDPVSALYKIGFSGELPEIPSVLSEEAKNFLEKCIRINPKERWSVKELLQHPFLNEPNSNSKQVQEPSSSSISPSSILDQAFWDSMEVSETPRNSTSTDTSSSSATGRLRRISSPIAPKWTDEENWVTIRGNEGENYSGEDRNYSVSDDEPTTSSGSDSSWLDEQDEETNESSESDCSSSSRIKASEKFNSNSVKICKSVCKNLNFERKHKQFLYTLNPIHLKP